MVFSAVGVAVVFDDVDDFGFHFDVVVAVSVVVVVVVAAAAAAAVVVGNYCDVFVEVEIYLMKRNEAQVIMVYRDC